MLSDSCAGSWDIWSDSVEVIWRAWEVQRIESKTNWGRRRKSLLIPHSLESRWADLQRAGTWGEGKEVSETVDSTESKGKAEEGRSGGDVQAKGRGDEPEKNVPQGEGRKGAREVKNLQASSRRAPEKRELNPQTRRLAREVTDHNSGGRAAL